MQASDHDILIRLEENVKTLHFEVKKLTDTHQTMLDDHEKRIRGLEGKNERWLGKESMIGGAIGVAATLIGSMIQGGKW